MKKLAKGLFIIVAIMAVLMVLAVKGGIKITRASNSMKKAAEAVEVEEKEKEETKKELDGVILFQTSERKFLCYEIVYTDKTHEVALDLKQLVAILNDNTNKMYVQDSNGCVKEVDSESKTMTDLRMAHAISDDLQ